jgi:hypothetical protein
MFCAVVKSGCVAMLGVHASAAERALHIAAQHPHIGVIITQETSMTPAAAANRTRSSFRSTMASIADVIVSAGVCAAAAESGHRPTSRALRAVGIDSVSWDAIGRR